MIIKGNQKVIVYLLLIAVFLILNSCTKTNNEDEPNVFDYKTSIFVVNEGTFNFGNASISRIDETTGTVDTQIFETTNGIPLGDVAQSMTFVGDTAYIVVNNSRKVEIVSARTFKQLGTINGLVAPRYLSPISEQLAYVSNIFSNEIAVIDLNTQQIAQTITFPCQRDTAFCWSEQMLLIEDKVWVASMKDAEILVIDIQTHEIEEIISVSIDPTDMILDADEKLWVLCGGGFCPICEPPALYRINTNTLNVENKWIMNESLGKPERLAISPDKQTIYYRQRNIFALPIHATALSTEAIVEANGRNFYHLAVHPNTGDLFITDAIDFLQNGLVYQIDGTTFMEVDTFRVGVVPSRLYFSW